MRLLLLSAILAVSTTSAQTLVPTLLTPLDASLNETSGLLLLGGQVWTQLDSGNPNALYQIDPATGAVLRTVTVSNASNVDWEDIATDGTWVYIGDFGNNAGSRADLRIYRVLVSELVDPGVFSVEADTIRFAYADQTDFTPADLATNWDCEAMVAMDDSLFLFTKNWLNSETYLYALSATPGDHLALRRDTLDSQGLVTGASYDPFTGAIALCGYTTTLAPFVWLLQGYGGHAFFDGSAIRHPLQLPLTQVEGIAWSSSGTAYLSNENNVLSPSRLWELGLDLSTGITEEDQADTALFTFDPVQRTIVLTLPSACMMNVFDTTGKVVLREGMQAGQNIVSVRSLSPGVYQLRTDIGAHRARFFIGP